MTDTPEEAAFPQPGYRHATLWRYMDVTKFAWLVENGRLFTPAA